MSARQTTGVQGGDLPPPPDGAARSGLRRRAPQPYTPPRATPRPAIRVPVVQLASVDARQQRRAADDARRAGRRIDRRRDQRRRRHASRPVRATRRGTSRSATASRSTQLAAANGGSTNVKLGQRIAIPGGRTQLARAAAAGRAGREPQSAGGRRRPLRPRRCRKCRSPRRSDAGASPQPAARREQQVALAPQTGNAGALAPAAPQPAAADASGFRWPVRGRVISGFGKKPNGERNDGINLAVPEGTSVKAAEDGTVIYAGNELKSYGNLVLDPPHQRLGLGLRPQQRAAGEARRRGQPRPGRSRSPACPAASPRRRSISSSARTRRRSTRCSI